MVEYSNLKIMSSGNYKSLQLLSADHVSQRNAEYFGDQVCSLYIFFWLDSVILYWVSDGWEYETWKKKNEKLRSVQIIFCRLKP